MSKATDGEYWKLVRQGMEDAVKDINKAYAFSSDDEISMTFEGPSDEQDIETQVNTLDAVIAEACRSTFRSNQTTTDSTAYRPCPATMPATTTADINS